VGKWFVVGERTMNDWKKTKKELIAEVQELRSRIDQGRSHDRSGEKSAKEADNRKAEEQYHDLYRLMRLMCDNAPDMIWAKDLSRRYVFVNQAACDKLLAAQDTEEPLGKTGMYFSERENNGHPDHPSWYTFGATCADSDDVVLERKKPQRFDEYGNVRGHYLNLEVYKAPIWDEEGEIIGIVGCGRDVTEKKILERRLEKNERRYRAVVEDQTDLIARYAPDLRITFANNAYCRFFDAAKDDIIGTHIETLLPEDQREQVVDNIQSLTQEYAVIRFERRVPAPHEDAYQWIDWTVRAIFDHNDNIAEYQSVGRDVTTLKETEEKLRKLTEEQEKRIERRTEELAAKNVELSDEIAIRERVESALRESEWKYRHLVENISEVIYAIDTAGIVTYVSPAVRQMTGFPADVFMGRHFEEIMHPEFREEAMEIFRFFDREKRPPFEFKIISKNKNPVWVRTTGTRVFRNGVFTGYQGVMADITGIKLSEFALRKSTERYRAIAEDIPAMVCRFLSDGTLIFVNTACCRHFRTKEDNLVGTPFWQWIPAGERQAMQKAFLSCTPKNPTINYQYRGVSPGGSEVWLEWTNHAIFDLIRGKVLEYQSLGRDITEKKIAEEQIKASLREKECLLREIHHRVKNNLQIVNSLIRTQMRRISDEKGKKLLWDTQSRILSMASIHKRLYHSEDLSTVDITEFIDFMGKELISTYRSQGQSIALKNDLENVQLVIERAIPLGLIYGELMTNAMKHAFHERKNGQITIALRQRDGSISLRIADDGVGLTPEQKNIQGETFGLHMVRLLSHQLRGSFEIDGRNGTVCTVTVPVRTA